ncbi:DnaB-like helicase N-terminal domain-containing protein [Streptomyces sp. bgisy095]|uniref:DnaB-like helicase N-terminal domain-containing protein n=1 Tax=unclassified Streptomyces TaxID=2593676 RepID=UPI003D7640A1
MPVPDIAPEPVGQEAVLRARVGRMLVEPGTIPETAAAVLPEDLSAPLALVYVSVLAVYASGEPVDPIAVGIHLHRRGLLADVGGSSFLAELVASASSVPAPAAAAGRRPPAVVVPLRTPARGVAASGPSAESEMWEKVIEHWCDPRGTLDEAHLGAVKRSMLLGVVGDVALVGVPTPKDKKLMEDLRMVQTIMMLRESFPQVRVLSLTVVEDVDVQAAR